MRNLILIILLFPCIAYGAVPGVPTGVTYSDPIWVEDSTLPEDIWADNIENWKASMFLGNFLTKGKWYDGPRLEVGGMRIPRDCVEGAAGKTYCVFAPSGSLGKNVVEIDRSTGIARLLMHETGEYVGDIGDVIGGDVFYNSYNSTLYISGLNCLRKIEGSVGARTVSLVAGVCGTSGNINGSEGTERLEFVYGWTAAQDGNMYLAQADELRKITTAGVVSTPSLSRVGETLLWKFPSEYYHTGFLYAGPDSDTLYLFDNYNTIDGYGVVEIDLVAAETATRIIGVSVTNDPYTRVGTNSCGTLLDHTAFKGGARGIYSQFYSAFFLDGNDAGYARMVQDNWSKIYALNPREFISSESYSLSELQTATGISAEGDFFVSGFNSPINNHCGEDAEGGIYMRFSRDLNSIWRLYNTAYGGTE